MKAETEALICATEEQALRINYVSHHIDGKAETSVCRLNRAGNEAVYHTICECSKLASREFKRSNDNVAKTVHWKLVEKYGLERKDKWYGLEPEGTVENSDTKLLSDINILCNHVIEIRRPDIILIIKVEKSCIVIDIAIPEDNKIHQRQKEKVEKYQELKREIERLLKLPNVQVVPAMVGALGSVTNALALWL